MTSPLDDIERIAGRELVAGRECAGWIDDERLAIPNVMVESALAERDELIREQARMLRMLWDDVEGDADQYEMYIADLRARVRGRKGASHD